jgi:hypothetical protein
MVCKLLVSKNNKEMDGILVLGVAGGSVLKL